ncbi:hypothetical protein T310_5534 [Rasamsonia emersonii CBS 393.64]|uniref:Uncharacterized protein n=1 Tax=Rasamsonia emersonii (strain ATCC 16479 / CBS 393.64 / IMI 116815) TaxID=1408163 RepID=A0A0F4YQB3_RASE3|nr:hypothetical protein T310_5534 [Rasamsonia emersonii CBS 393.64]KKA20444.1 hypothetical protein T310_5534 [Rasamsonia emersonii CBS 393.64]
MSKSTSSSSPTPESPSPRAPCHQGRCPAASRSGFHPSSRCRRAGCMGCRLYEMSEGLSNVYMYMCVHTRTSRNPTWVPADDGPILEKRRSLPQVGVDVDTIRGSSSSGGESKGEEDLLNRCHFLFVLLIGR